MQSQRVIEVKIEIESRKRIINDNKITYRKLVESNQKKILRRKEENEDRFS